MWSTRSGLRKYHFLVKAIAEAEKQYQEALNVNFRDLGSEEACKLARDGCKARREALRSAQNELAILLDVSVNELII